MDNLENAFQWICKLRKDYSPNSDIWNLRREWERIRDDFLAQLNDGSYGFDPLDRYEFDDGILSLRSSRDMLALKLISQALQEQLTGHIPRSCYHVKGHGGLKKAVEQTWAALPEHHHVMRSDIKSYYESIDFTVLMDIIKAYVNHPVLLKLIRKALSRTETRGGIFFDYETHGIAKGSPLSPLLGAVALIPLDQAMGKIKGIFYARFQDDWLVLAKSKSALRKVVRITHKVVNALKLQLHPTKTYIGKISHGFNFLGYYFDQEKILPSMESFRRFSERAAVRLYEQSQGDKSRRRGNNVRRDISEYQVNEPAPTDVSFRDILSRLSGLALQKQSTLGALRRYVRKWGRYLNVGLSPLAGFDASLRTLLPTVYSCLTEGVYALGGAYAG
jgi:hypothetical protein